MSTTPTEGRLQQGFLLHTRQTATWTEAEREHAMAIERTMLFTNFSGFDDGRSRVFVAKCENPEDARRLVACWNAFDGVPTEKIEGKSVSEYIANEAYITGLVPVAAGGMELGLSGDACQLLAESFAGQFKGSGGINFIEVQMSHKDMGPFTVTIQRQHGETPAQQKAAALKGLAEANTLLSDVLETFDEYMPADHEVADRIRAFLKGGAA